VGLNILCDGYTLGINVRHIFGCMYVCIIWGVFYFICKFTRCSHQVHTMFPKFPKTFPIAPHFILCPKVYSWNQYRQSPKEERSHDMYFGTVQSLIFYFILFYCDGPIKDANHKRGKIEPLRMPATNEYESQYIVA
jgi:hypothetical protein